MKYSLNLPPPSQRDHAHQAPRGPSPIFKDILGACLFFFAVLLNVVFILGL